MVKRLWMLSAVCLWLAGSSLSMVACRARTPEEAHEVPPELRFEGVRYQVYRGARLESWGSAAVASFRRDTTALAARGIKVHFPADSSRGAADMSAVWGRGSLRPREFLAGGGIEAQQDRQQFVTEEARYSDKDGLVRGDRPIVIRRPGMTTTEPGFTLDPKTGLFESTGAGQIDLEEGKGR